MKKKREIKKILALLLAAVMALGMGATAFATEEDENPEPQGEITASESDKANITVYGLKAGDIVTAYQIIKADYNSSGFVEYQWAVDFPNNTTTDYKQKNSSVEFTTETKDDVETDVVTGLTSDNITAYANHVQNKENNVKETGSATADENGVATLNLPAGSFMILVSKTDGAVVYNPMIASNYYSVSGSNNSISTNDVSAKDKWGLETTNAYVKSSEPTVSKVIVEGENSLKGNDVSFGDKVSFKITATIPSYSADYTDITYTITDELSEGLKLDASSVKVYLPDSENADNELTEVLAEVENFKNFSISTTPESDKGETYDYKITFTDGFVRAHGNQTLTIKYSAMLTGYDDDGNQIAETNAVPNTNKVTLEYSNDPTDSSKTNKKDDRTYTYSFELDGNVYGKQTHEHSTKWDEETYEIIKTDDGTATRLINQEGHHIAGSDEVRNLGLAGAEFTLTQLNSEGKATSNTWTATTDESGYMNFVGLDAGKYTLAETKAPDGYSINSETVDVGITAEYNEDGTLKSWTVKIGENVTNTYTLEYDGGTEVTKETRPTVTHTVNNGIDGATIIKNTKLSSLPSTGGIGTTIFTVAGIVLMVGAAGYFLASKRKEKDS